MWKRIVALLIVMMAVSITALHAQEDNSHLRLWLRADDVTRLRGWAREDNPLWGQLVALTDETIAEMDSGNFPNGDTGGNSYEDYNNENAAMLLAFMSLVSPDESLRADYAARARTLLMYVINQALPGQAGAPFRDPDFSINDRSRWHGEAFPLTVNWIYPILSAEDKATIRTVFLRWSEELHTAGMTNNNHPEPLDVVNDPVLVEDRAYARWSNNNYYLAHMRNMGLMAMALDPADDPDGALHAYLDEATGAWLYIIDNMTRTDILGGFGAEGLEYSPQSSGYYAQFLLALYTAGEADVAERGQQVVFEDNPFWDDSVTAYLHSLSPTTAQHEYLGDVYLPAWYGSGQSYFMPDSIQQFGAQGFYDMLTGNTERLNALRWIQLHTAPGGVDQVLERMDFEQFDYAILYFMLFDPDAPEPTDPRVSLPTTYYAPGMRRLLARTDWSENATWFTYNNSWDMIDHQTGNAGAVEFYRGGEWLTKIRVGYDLDYLTSENLNSLSIQNTPPEHDDWRGMVGERGSQWLYVTDGDPAQPVITQGESYVAAYGEMTNVYNSTYEGSTDIVKAARSVVWLSPDVIVIYDQAVTKAAGFKRFSLNLPASATTEGNLTTMTSPKGQQFWINTLLPAGATISVNPLEDEISAAPANGEMMAYRFSVEAPENPTAAYFLNVLVGGDAGATPPEIELVSDDPAAPVVRIGAKTIHFTADAITVEG
jgi:hypothetical protein